MLDEESADLMFAPKLRAVTEWEAAYPQRHLPVGALVTRFAPSPTGYLHVGGLYAALVAGELARNSNGVFFVRIENTDTAREIPEARMQFEQAFSYFGIVSDETDGAPWGPYDQRSRAAIYESYARELVRRGLAYPCFCTPADLQALAARQQASKASPGYYAQWATCRDLDPQEAKRRLRAGVPYVVRFRAPDGQPGRCLFHDEIRGQISQLDNRNDAVLLKSSDLSLRLPTYHFAHVVDDHLMRVNLVTRGEEWIPSMPLHLQLFGALGFEAPAYAHFAPLMKIEGNSKRKLSKRKDPEATVGFYMKLGYPAGAVKQYLRALANSNLQDLTAEEAARIPLRLDGMGVAGPVFDHQKLDSISRNYITDLPASERLAALESWSRQYAPEIADILDRDRNFALRAFQYEAELEENPRKDLAHWSQFLEAYEFYLPSAFRSPTTTSSDAFSPTSAAKIRALATDLASAYHPAADRDSWFAQIRQAALRNGFAPTVGEFKRTPERFVGPLSEAANVVRVAITGRRQSPDLYMVCQVIGEAEVVRRLKALESL